MAAPKWKDLVTDQGTGALSSTKIWSHVSKFVATIIVLYMTYTANMNDMILLIYMGALASETLLSKLISFRLGGGNNTANPLPDQSKTSNDQQDNKPDPV